MGWQNKNVDSCLSACMLKIAFIGTNGIPNKYGGFESFLDAVCPELVLKGCDVTVTCDAGKHEDFSPCLNGVRRLFVNVNANGVLSTWHDFLAFLRVLGKVDAIVVLGVSAGPFFLIFRLLAEVYSVKLVVNVDGVEWRRSKFRMPTRVVLWTYDFLAQLAANVIVYDNPALKEFVCKAFRDKSIYIPYSSDHVARDDSIDIAAGKALTICRIEPENNIDMLIDGFLKSGVGEYTIIGNWNNSPYGVSLKNKYKGIPNLNLLDPIYDPEIVLRHRESCQYYLHGHSVGGTNPSLLEMIPYRCLLICFDCVFNVETVGDEAFYFKSSDDLAACLRELHSKALSCGGRSIPLRYRKVNIAKQYIAAATNDSD